MLKLVARSDDVRSKYAPIIIPVSTMKEGDKCSIAA